MSERPDVQHRVEFSIEVPASADQVWQAIATGDGVSSWFLPHEIEGRVGGRFVVHMGETDSVGQVTGWEPPRRFAVEEDWATLLGHPGADVTPLATEFLVEARSGGTCVVRVVSSAFGSGADWESEFFDEMARFWQPFFDLLRVYVARFSGQRATTRTVVRDLDAPPGAIARAMARSLGVTAAGQAVDAHGLRGHVIRLGEPYLMVEVDDPAPGYMSFAALHNQDRTVAQVGAWLFGDAAEPTLDAAEPQWRTWLDQLVIPEAVKR